MTAASICDRCRELGFAAAGVAAAQPTAHADALRDWLAEGQHGTMSYLERHAPLLVDPAELLPGARSVICVTDRYGDGRPDRELPAGHGRIARYARGRDYHKVMKKRLHALADDLQREHPAEQFRSCVDTAPLLEREYAAAAGLGAIGKHTLLIDRGIGSWFFLGAIVTTLDLAPSRPAEPDPCGTCTRCIDACPTDAITPFSVDGSRCISYLTIEHRAVIDQSLHAPIGDWLFGCDICQEVCPHNQPTDRTTSAQVHSEYTPRRSSLDLLEILNWTADDRLDACAGTSMTRAKLDMMQRNALIVAANTMSDSSAHQQRVKELATDLDAADVVRETAQQIQARGRAAQ